MDTMSNRIYIRRNGILYCLDGRNPWTLEFSDGVTIEVSVEATNPIFDPILNVPQEDKSLYADQFMQLPLQTPTVKISRGYY